jgi:hypothetical protein
MSMRQGLRVFGKEGEQAIKKEMAQLHTRTVMKPTHKKDLSPAQRREALEYLMFLKRKRSGDVKGRGCADGRKQREYIPHDEATSPTASTNAIMLTAVIDAFEGRDVAILDVPGAFMQAFMDELVHVVFRGIMVELLLEIDWDMYSPYIVYEKGKKVLYVELIKALYGTLRAARLFWETLSKKLLEWGFETNPYDLCVMNKKVNGKQMTVAWHVDDIKVSHVDRNVVDDFIDNYLEPEFGQEAPLNKSRGKKQEYLGMSFDFSTPGTVTVGMEDFVAMMCTDLPKEMIGSASTPAAGHLFKINSTNPQVLNDKDRDIFVRLVMQALYLSQRARPDIRTAVSFLSSRLHTPDKDDYHKLARLMKYLQATPDLHLTLSSNGTGNVYWWVDASYTSHEDMKGHTGATMSLGYGSVYSSSTKQRIVTRSSTEGEMVGVYDAMPQILWTKRFLQAQGFSGNDTVLYQDNKSSILLEKNGRMSSSKRTKHMNVRYFFIKDQVDAKEVRIEYCPTENMIADFFTKPLTGTLFFKLRDLIMNIDPSSKYSWAQRSVLMGNAESNMKVCKNVDDGNCIGNKLDEEHVTRKSYRDVLVSGVDVPEYAKN